MYPEKVKIFFKKELEERLRMLHPEEEHLSAEELQKISIDRLYQPRRTQTNLDQNLVKMMKLHHKKHAENLKQYLEWKNTQSKQHDQTKTDKKTDVKVKNEADMAL